MKGNRESQEVFKSSVRVTAQTPDPLGEASCVCCLWSCRCVYRSVLPHLMQAWNTLVYLSKHPSCCRPLA